LRELRQQHGETPCFPGFGEHYSCVHLAPNVLSIGDEREFNIRINFQLANALARSALLEFFKANGNETVIGFRPVTLIRQKPIGQRTKRRVRHSPGVHARMFAAWLRHEGLITSGLLVCFGVRNCVSQTAAELLLKEFAYGTLPRAVREGR